jgi:hypothetical protein
VERTPTRPHPNHPPRQTPTQPRRLINSNDHQGRAGWGGSRLRRSVSQAARAGAPVSHSSAAIGMPGTSVAKALRPSPSAPVNRS